MPSECALISLSVVSCSVIENFPLTDEYFKLPNFFILLSRVISLCRSLQLAHSLKYRFSSVGNLFSKTYEITQFFCLLFSLNIRLI